MSKKTKIIFNTLQQRLGLVGAALFASIGSQTELQAKPASRPGEFVVKFRTGAKNRLGIQSQGFQIQENLGSASGLALVKMKNGKVFAKKQKVDIGQAQSLSFQLHALNELTDIEYVEPNYIYTTQLGAKPPADTPNPDPVTGVDPEESLPSVMPDDADFSLLWGLRNVGQKDPKGILGRVGADIDATNAWSLTTGSRDVIVGIIDTGMDYTHPDLIPNLWVAPKVNPTDPDVHGLNAISGALDPMDDNGHGTHCAGTIGASGQNQMGVVGVNMRVSLMACKFLSSTGSGSLADAIKCIDYMRENGAHVMSNSWGGGGYSQALEEAIVRARDSGILFVAAAGNESNDNDKKPSYPASYKVDNVVSVAATNNDDGLAYFSNTGKTSVHLGAPGKNIYSTYIMKETAYKSLSGTSMATPHVAGAAALLKAYIPSVSYAEIKSRLMSSVDKGTPLKETTVSGGRLNVYRLLKD
jgi:subtilisin family serine protease